MWSSENMDEATPEDVPDPDRWRVWTAAPEREQYILVPVWAETVGLHTPGYLVTGRSMTHRISPHSVLTFVHYGMEAVEDRDEYDVTEILDAVEYVARDGYPEQIGEPYGPDPE